MATKTATAVRHRTSTGKHRLIVIGASAGGIEAVAKLLSELPANLSAAVLVVIHVSAESPNLLPRILQRQSRLKLVEISDCDAIRPGCVYVAPPDHHLLVNDGHLRLSNGPYENRHRPAIDPLFRSAAGARGSKVIGVILTGNLGDGAAGLQAIKECGGLTVVQEPKDAMYPDMPRNALERTAPDYVVPLAGMGDLLKSLVQQPPRRVERSAPCLVQAEAEIADMGLPLNQMDNLGNRSQFACPDCHGVLWEVREKKQVHFRCRVGHSYSPESLGAAMSDGVETALWIAVRALEEKISLLERMSVDSRTRHHPVSARQFKMRADELKPAVLSVRALIQKLASQKKSKKAAKG